MVATGLRVEAICDVVVDVDLFAPSLLRDREWAWHDRSDQLL